MALCPGLPGWAGARKIKPIWILLKQKPVSGSGISWAICKSAPRSRQITTPAHHHSVLYRPDALPAAQPIQFFTGRMPFLPPNQQCQSTECSDYKGAINHKLCWKCSKKLLKVYTFIANIQKSKNCFKSPSKNSLIKVVKTQLNI